MLEAGMSVPQVEFVFRENGEFVTQTSSDLFDYKRVVLFALPGAFTPTCSSTHLPTYEEMYEEIKTQYEIDEIYCLSVNDAFVMNAWAKDLNIKNVKLIPDGNCKFTEKIGALVRKDNLGFGARSWRYSAVIDDGIIEKIFVEPGIRHNANEDPFVVSDAHTMVDYLKSASLVATNS